MITEFKGTGSYKNLRRSRRGAPFHFTAHRTNINSRRARYLNNTHDRLLIHVLIQISRTKEKKNNYIKTLFAADSIGDLNASNAGVSTVLRDLRPPALARILNPLSAVLTARRFPSLLNLKCGSP